MRAIIRNLRTFLGNWRFNRSAALAAAFVFWKMGGILGTEPLAGWDTMPHQYAIQFAGDHIFSQGYMSGWCANWFSGFPFLYFYSPLPYFVVVGLKWLSLGYLNYFAAFRLSLLLASLTFVYSFSRCSRAFFGERVTPYAHLCSLVVLCADPEYGYLGMGWPGGIGVGLFANFFASSLLLLVMATYQELLDSPSPLRAMRFGLVGGLLILMHMLSALLAGFCLAVLTALSAARVTRNWRYMLLSATVAGLISIGWVVPFLTNLRFTSSEKLTGLVGAADPLEFFIELSSPRAWLLLSALLGGALLVRRRQFEIPALFLLGTILLPRNYFFDLMDLGIHYYRFLTGLYVIFALLASYGMMRFVEATYTAPIPVRTPLRWIVLGTTLLMLLTYSIEERGGQHTLKYTYSLGDRPYSAAASAMMASLSDSPPLSRVFVENTLSLLAPLGSLHYFLMTIPGELDLPILQGLFTESSLSTPFIMAVAKGLSDATVWGHAPLAEDRDFLTQPVSAHVARLRLLGCDRVISVSPKLKNALADQRLVTDAPPFRLVELDDDTCLVRLPPHLPGLFLGPYSGREPSWKTFSEDWFATPTLLDFPVAFQETDDLSDLHDNFADGFPYVIISAAASRDPFALQRSVRQLLAQGKRVAIIGESSYSDASPRVGIVPSYGPGDRAGISAFAGILSRWVATDTILFQTDTRVACTLVSRNHEALNITTSGLAPVMIRESYFPHWRMAGGGRVYLATPSYMMTFLEGGDRLAFTRPPLELVLSCISISALLVTLGAILLMRRSDAVRGTL